MLGWTCPLTPLEKFLRNAGGEEGYSGGFIDHYLTSLIYPEGLTRDMQITLGLIALATNIVIYSFAIYWWKYKKR